MSRGVSGLKGTAAGLRAASVCAAFILLLGCAAQGRAQRGGLPRVATVKDYPATGLTVGCGNYYSYLAHQAGSPGAAYVFLARSDGSNAWMNLGGRDVRLRQIKSAARAGRQARQFNYRHGRLGISVQFEDLKPGEPRAEADFMFRLRIILRQGRAARIVHAVGYSDC